MRLPPPACGPVAGVFFCRTHSAARAVSGSVWVAISGTSTDNRTNIIKADTSQDMPEFLEHGWCTVSIIYLILPDIRH